MFCHQGKKGKLFLKLVFVSNLLCSSGQTLVFQRQSLNPLAVALKFVNLQIQHPVSAGSGSQRGSKDTKLLAVNFTLWNKIKVSDIILEGQAASWIRTGGRT